MPNAAAVTDSGWTRIEGNEGAWTSWCTIATTSCTTNSTDYVWTVWAGDTTASFDGAVWRSWTTASGTTTNVDIGTYTPPTQEQRDRWAEEARERKEREQAAIAKAEKLLRETLTDEQRAEMDTHKYFTVESKTSKRRYRVRTDKGRHGNIEELDEHGNAVSKLCAAPTGPIPDADCLVGQALFLQHDEEAFRRKANFTPLRRTA